MIKDRIKEFVAHLGISIRQFEVKCGFSNGFVNNIGKSIGHDKIEKILHTYPELSEQWLISGVGNMLTNTLSPKTNEASLLNQTLIMNIPLVNQYAYAGYTSGYQDETYIAHLPVIPFFVDHEAKGNYMAFEVRGDSMDDGTADSYIEGDRLLCREIPQNLWCQTRLHLRKWDFVIVHKEGILIKRIINHDVPNHTITIHSLNPLFEDHTIDLADVHQIFNVIELQRPRRR